MPAAERRESELETLPDEQRAALRKAIGWQVGTIVFTAFTITGTAFVVGNSQAMKTAWVEDMLSLIPQFSFLIALLFLRRKPSKKYPYGMHRAMGIGHVVAGLALFVVGTNLAFESASGLVMGEHPAIGSVSLFGQTVWLGWLMVSWMSLIVIGPLIYGRAKAKLAPKLNNKVLYADADMAKADWQTNAATVIGVIGVGMGVWWLDGMAALFISLSIIWDGLLNLRAALLDLMDRRAQKYNETGPHPVTDDVVDYLRSRAWVADAGVRMRDQGQVFHVEAFVVPTTGSVTTGEIEATVEGIRALDWKLNDVVVMPVDEIPHQADRGNGDS